MRWILMLCLLLLVGCTTLTEEQARAICDEVGTSEELFNEHVDFAEDDEADGLSASESRELFADDCDDICSNGPATCIGECTICTDAVVNYVYSN